MPLSWLMMSIRRRGDAALKACSCLTIYMDVVPKVQAIKEDHGVFKMVIHPESSKIVGMHIVSPNAADLIYGATLAVKFGLTIDDIIETDHVIRYPH